MAQVDKSAYGIIDGMQTDKRIRINAGYLITLLIVAIPTFGWMVGYNFAALNPWQATAVTLAKVGAFGGMAMFAVSLILSGRYVWLDKLFNGLDKVYVSHRFFGTFSTALLLLHPIGLTLARQRTMLETIEFWLGGGRVGLSFGVFALYGLIGLVLWSIFSKSRYETFVLVHRWLGVFFISGAVHAFLIGNVLGTQGWLFWYMLVLSIAGGLTFIVYSLLGDLLHRPIKYRVLDSVLRTNGVTVVTLEPMRRILRFSPGQFVYVSFPDLEDTSFHPLSMASGKKDSRLRLAVRKVGDFSAQVSELKPGASALIKGPYGGFTFLPARRQKQIWIAGGIGVTPFISGAHSLEHSPKKGQIEMVYATDDDEPFGLDELETIEQKNPSFNVTLFNSKQFGYLTLEMLKQQFQDFNERHIYLCGPPVMTEKLAAEAQHLGIAHRLKFEEFDY